MTEIYNFLFGRSFLGHPVAVNTSNSGGIDSKTKLNFNPISMRFDYKTFTIYATYINTTISYVSSVGILDRTKGAISEVVGIINNNPNIAVTSLSTYDTAEGIFYASIELTGPIVPGVSYAKVDKSDLKSFLLLKATYFSYGWFIKQFVH